MTRRPWSPLEHAALVATAIVVLLMAWSVLSLPVVSVDGRTLWGFHARLLLDAGRFPAPELSDPGFPIPHRQYPPFLPVLDAVALRILPVDRALRVVPWLFYLGTASVLLRVLPRRDPARGRLLALAYALMPTLVLSEEGGADAGVADTVLAAWVLGTALALDAGRPAVAGLLASAAALTKNEGLVLGPLVLATAYVRCGGDRGRLRPAFLGVATFAAMVLPWLWIRAAIPEGFDERYASRLTLAQLSGGLERAPAVLVEMARVAFVHPQRSGLFWWIVVFLWATSPARRLVLLEGRLVVLPLYLAIVGVLYLVSPWPGVTQVQLSFERILLQLAPLALLGLTAGPAPPIIKI